MSWKQKSADWSNVPRGQMRFNAIKSRLNWNMWAKLENTWTSLTGCPKSPTWTGRALWEQLAFEIKFVWLKTLIQWWTISSHHIYSAHLLLILCSVACLLMRFFALHVVSWKRWLRYYVYEYEVYLFLNERSHRKACCQNSGHFLRIMSWGGFGADLCSSVYVSDQPALNLMLDHLLESFSV